MSDTKTSIQDLKALMVEFVSERKWWKYHNPKNLAISINVESSELLELFQWVENDKDSIGQTTLTNVGEEMADILAYLLSMSHVLGIDLSSAFQNKMVKNSQKYPAEKFQGNWEKA